MTAQKLDGTATAAAIREDLRLRVKALAERGILPGLGTVLVGDDPASRTYVAGKHRDCAEIGVASIQRELPADATQDAVEAVVDELNADPACTGYLVQLPLPRQLDEQRVLERMLPAKDVDGLHPVNLGRLVLQKPGALPCTPRGIVELLRRFGVPTTGPRSSWSGAGSPPAARSACCSAGAGRTPPSRPVPHRHPRPGRAHPPGRHRGDGGRRARSARRPTWCVRARPCWTWGRPAWWARTARPAWSATSTRTSVRSPGTSHRYPGGVGPMTRAMLLTNVVSIAENRLG